MMNFLIGILTFFHCTRYVCTRDVISRDSIVEKLNEYRDSTLEQDLSEYITVQEVRIKSLQSISQQLQSLSTEVHIVDDREAEISSDFDVYDAIKNHTSVIGEVLEKLKKLTYSSENGTVPESILSDLKETYGLPIEMAGEYVTLLQSIYNLKTDAVANGDVYGYSSIPMSASDCLSLALDSYEIYDHYYAAEWVREAKIRVFEDGDPTETMATILQQASKAASKAGNHVAAAKLSADLMDMFPDNLEIHHYCEGIILKAGVALRNATKEERLQQKLLETRQVSLPLVSALCRGVQVKKVEKGLSCSYGDNGHPLLLLQPVKQEIVYSDPHVVVMHDVLHDKLLDTMKYFNEKDVHRDRKMSYEYILKLISALTHGKNPENYLVSDIKFSAKTSSFKKTINFLSNYFQHSPFYMGGLKIQPKALQEAYSYTSVSTANSLKPDQMPITMYSRLCNTKLYYRLQMQIESVSSSYNKAHITRSAKFTPEWPGDMEEYITLYGFLNEPKAGGAIFFPAIHLTVVPKKGTMVLMKTTKHHDEHYSTNCPVLVGEKWTMEAMIGR